MLPVHKLMSRNRHDILRASFLATVFSSNPSFVVIHRKSGRFPPETRRCGSCRLCCGNSAAKTFWIASSHANAEHHKRVGLHYISIFKSRRCKSRVYFLHPAEKSWSDRGRDELGPKVTAFSRFNIMGVALSSCTTKTGRILDSRRTPQKVGLLQFALRLRARLNPSRDSAGRTIVMQWQRRVKNHSSGGQTLCLVTHLWRLSFFASMVCRSTNQPTISTESSRRTEENPLHVVMSGNDLANYGCHGVVTIRASVEFETCRESKKWAQQPSHYPLRRLRRLPNLASTTDPEIFVRGASLLFMYGARHVVNPPALRSLSDGKISHQTDRSCVACSLALTCIETNRATNTAKYNCPVTASAEQRVCATESMGTMPA